MSAAACSAARSEFDQIFPRDGWVEHDPEVLWDTTLYARRGALADAGIEARALTGIGITNQRETTLIWDARHRRARLQRDRLAGPAHRAALRAAFAPTAWRIDRDADRPRHRSVLFEHQDRLAARQRSRTAARAPRGQAALRHRRQLPDLAADVGAMHSTDATNASRTHSSISARQRWDPELLRYFDVPRGAAARRPRLRRGLWCRRRRVARRAGADSGRRRRPAGRADRSGLLRRRDDQEHLRHRLFPRDQHRRSVDPFHARLACRRSATASAA